jgi:hypothetical protein
MYNIMWLNWIIYNYCTSLSAIWCVMEHWKAILTKAEGRRQYCFSVFHNTSYCTKWSAVIVLLHLTFHIFCVYMDQFLGIVCCFFQIHSMKCNNCILFNLITLCYTCMPHWIYISFILKKKRCTHLVVSNCFITFNIPRFLCVHGSIFRDCLLFFSNSKYMSWSI